jgi:hypothetical protein
MTVANEALRGMVDGLDPDRVPKLARFFAEAKTQGSPLQELFARNRITWSPLQDKLLQGLRILKESLDRPLEKREFSIPESALFLRVPVSRPAVGCAQSL